MRILVCCLIAGLFLGACSGPEASYTYHGDKIETQKAVPVAELTAMMEKDGGFDNIKVEGNIEACCKAKGCWITMKLDDEKDMRVRFKDYGFFVPLDSEGKKAIIEGKAYYDTVPVEDLRHYAMDAGMTKEEAEAKYTEPELTINFEAHGVAIEEPEKKDAE